MQGGKTIAIAINVVAVIAVCTLAACGGTKSNSPANASSAASASTSTTVSTPVAALSSSATASGATVFMDNCSSCHQANGEGVPGTYPPLAGNAVVTGPAAKVVHIVKHGLSGPIVVRGTSYNGQMPAWNGTLSDPDIASVITYIRSAWGNKAGAVTVSVVTATK